MSSAKESHDAIRDLLALGLDTTTAHPPSRSPAPSPEAETDLSVPLPASPYPGLRIGRYELLAPLGEGGFGLVWRARQLEPIVREVALKLLKPGMDSREISARFAAERQILARLEHPHIARVLDAGSTERGQLYFVMELVEGPPLTEYCDVRKLPVPERLGLFLDVCEAIQHAHRKALLHRDLKPSNLLVGESGGIPEPKVIDFGVAKALAGSEDPGLTLTGDGLLVGTPRYMSPEQAGLHPDVDVRGDVYSLGVVLHELLTGRAPLDALVAPGAPLDVLLRTIREREPARPATLIRPGEEESEAIAARRACSARQLRRLLEGDLDWILLRALETDRERRYQSVGELASDLRRHLASEPVDASPPSSVYRARKFVARNAILVGGVAATIAMLLLGLALTGWQAVRATRAERTAENRLKMAEKARDAAETLLTDTVVGMRNRLMPVGRTDLMSGTLDSAVQYLEQLPDDLDNRITREQAVFLGFNRGGVALLEGRLDESQVIFDETLVKIAELEQTAPLREPLQRDAVFVQLIAAQAWFEDDDYENSARFRDLARARCEAWIDSHPESLWPYACLAQEAALAALEAALVRRQPLEALPHLLRLGKYEDRLAELDDQSVEYHQAAGLKLFCSAFAASHLGKSPEDAIALFEQAAEVFRLAHEDDQDQTFRFIYLNLQLSAETAAGTRLIDLGAEQADEAKIAKGRDLILGAFERRLEMSKWDPDRVSWWKDLAGSAKQMVHIARHSGDPAEAGALVDRVIGLGPEIAAHLGTRAEANHVLCDALTAALRWKVEQERAWTEADLEALKLAWIAWSTASTKRPGYYSSEADLSKLERLLTDARRQSSPQLEVALDRCLLAICSHIESLGATGAPDLQRVLANLRFLALFHEFESSPPDAAGADQNLQRFQHLLTLLPALERGSPAKTFDSVYYLGGAMERWLGRLSADDRDGVLASLDAAVGDALARWGEDPNPPDETARQALVWATWKLRVGIERYTPGRTHQETVPEMMAVFRAASATAGFGKSDPAFAARWTGRHLSLLDSQRWIETQEGNHDTARTLCDEMERVLAETPHESIRADYAGKVERARLNLDFREMYDAFRTSKPENESMAVQIDRFREMLEIVPAFETVSKVDAFDLLGDLSSSLSTWLGSLTPETRPAALAEVERLSEEFQTTVEQAIGSEPESFPRHAVLWRALELRITLDRFSPGGSRDETFLEMIEVWRRAEPLEPAGADESALLSYWRERHLQFLDARGWLYQIMGRDHLAPAAFAESIRVFRTEPNPNSVDFRYEGNAHLGLALIALAAGDPGECESAAARAVAAYESSLRLKPGSPAPSNRLLAARLVAAAARAGEQSGTELAASVETLAAEQAGLVFDLETGRSLNYLDQGWSLLHEQIGPENEAARKRARIAWRRVREAFLATNPSITYTRRLRPIPDDDPPAAGE